MNEHLKGQAEAMAEEIEHTVAWAAKHAQDQAELDRFRIELLHAVMGTKGERGPLLLELGRVMR